MSSAGGTVHIAYACTQIKILANPVFFDGEKLPISRPPPVHSQHTSEILMEEGYTAEDIAQLKSEGAI